MKLGVSTYSLYQALKAKKMTVLDVIDWIANLGGEHVEIVPMGFHFTDQPELVDAIRDKAAALGIEVSNYAIAANFIQATKEAYEAEIDRVLGEVRIAHRLGATRMRHDVVGWLPAASDTSIARFEQDLPLITEACQRIADYAAQFGIITSLENHGFYIQASDRVQRVVNEVKRENFRTTLDVGNFLCVDENPLVAVKKNVPFASMVHIKDFYVRDFNPGEGWFPTTGGYYLRGAIAGHGDLNLRKILAEIKNAGYDGYISIEFEGMEDCEIGTRIGLETVRKLWEQV